MARRPARTSVVTQPGAAATALSGFVGSTIGQAQLTAAQRDGPVRSEPGSWRRLLTPAQLSEIESVAGPDLRRVGYLD